MPGGGGVNPTSMAENDTHVALIILTTQMWGGGGKLLVEKTFSGQNLCFCAFGANIRSYTNQRARHGTPFLQPPPPSCGGRPCHPPPPPPQSKFQVALGCLRARAVRSCTPPRALARRRSARCLRRPLGAHPWIGRALGGGGDRRGPRHPFRAAHEQEGRATAIERCGSPHTSGVRQLVLLLSTTSATPALGRVMPLALTVLLTTLPFMPFAPFIARWLIQIPIVL